MPFEDYLRSRVADLMVSIFYNDVLSERTFSQLSKDGLSAFPWLNNIIQGPHSHFLAALIAEFKEACKAELYDSDDQIDAILSHPDVFAMFDDGRIGRNNTFHFRDKARKNAEEILGVSRDAALAVFGPRLAEMICEDFARLLGCAPLPASQALGDAR